MNSILINKKFKQTLFILATISFLWIAIFGLSGMGEMKANASINDCLFSNGQTKLCPMNLFDHISLWQSALTGLPKDSESLSLLILVIIMLSAVIVFWKKPFLKFSEYVTTRLRLYIKKHSRIHVYDFLREIFSQGILNPKIYEIVNL